MIKKIINKFRNTEYIDFTNNTWKYNTLVGLRITTRKYKKVALWASMGVITLSLLTPFTNFFLFPTAFWILRRYG